jgi:hypothetical protein
MHLWDKANITEFLSCSYRVLLEYFVGKWISVSDIASYMMVFLCELSFQLAPALTYIYQKSITVGEVPDDWKMAHVVPLGFTRSPAPESVLCFSKDSMFLNV